MHHYSSYEEKNMLHFTTNSSTEKTYLCSVTEQQNLRNADNRNGRHQILGLLLAFYHCFLQQHSKFPITKALKKFPRQFPTGGKCWCGLGGDKAHSCKDLSRQRHLSIDQDLARFHDSKRCHNMSLCVILYWLHLWIDMWDFLGMIKFSFATTEVCPYGSELWMILRKSC